MYNFLISFNYILFSLIFFIGQPNMKKSFSFIFFFFSWYFSRVKHTLRLCLIPGKYKGKKKNAKENNFLMFDCPMKNIKENQI